MIAFGIIAVLAFLLVWMTIKVVPQQTAFVVVSCSPKPQPL